MVYVQLKKATTKGKKYTAVFYDEERKKIKSTSFGATGYQDFTSHGHDAEERKRLYLERHKSSENWADYKSAGSLSRYILWNKSSVSASFSAYLKTFGLKKY